MIKQILVASLLISSCAFAADEQEKKSCSSDPKAYAVGGISALLIIAACMHSEQMPTAVNDTRTQDWLTNNSTVPANTSNCTYEITRCSRPTTCDPLAEPKGLKNKKGLEKYCQEYRKKHPNKDCYYIKKECGSVTVEEPSMIISIVGTCAAMGAGIYRAIHEMCTNKNCP